MPWVLPLENSQSHSCISSSAGEHQPSVCVESVSWVSFWFLISQEMYKMLLTSSSFLIDNSTGMTFDVGDIQFWMM